MSAAIEKPKNIKVKEGEAENEKLEKLLLAPKVIVAKSEQSAGRKQRNFLKLI